MELPSSFNIFDVLGRLIPGSILASWGYILYRPYLYKYLAPLSSMKVIIFIAVSYALGILMKAPANILSKSINKRVFGGDPRCLYALYKEKTNQEGNCTPDEENKKNIRKLKHKKKYVIKNRATRRLAKEVRDAIVDMYFNDAAKNDVSKGSLSAFAFGYMINYLESKGKADKQNRISVLEDMCSSMLAVVSVGGLLHIILVMYNLIPCFKGKASIHQLLSTEILCFAGTEIVCFIILYVCFRWLYIRYKRMRASIIVRSFIVAKAIGRDQG